MIRRQTAIRQQTFGGGVEGSGVPARGGDGARMRINERERGLRHAAAAQRISQQVDEEHIEHRCLAKYDEIYYVKSDIQYYEHQFQRCKVDRSLLIAQIAER